MSGGALLYSPGKVCRIIAAYCTLHNLALQRNIPLPDDEGDQAEPPGEDVEEGHGEDSGDEEGGDIHQDLINTYFS